MIMEWMVAAYVGAGGAVVLAVLIWIYVDMKREE